MPMGNSIPTFRGNMVSSSSGIGRSFLVFFLRICRPFKIRKLHAGPPPIQRVCRSIRKIIKEVVRSRWPRGLRRGSVASLLLGLRVRIPPGSWITVRCECCVLAGRDKLIPHRKDSCQVCVCVCVSLTVIKTNSHPVRLR